MRTKLLWAFLLVSAGLGGCGTDTSLSQGKYRTDCTLSSECVAVFLGDVCGSACACANAAINRADANKYQADFDRAKAACGQMRPCTISCVAMDVACPAGTCTLVTRGPR